MAKQRSLTLRAVASTYTVLLLAAVAAACSDSSFTSEPQLARGPKPGGGGGGGEPEPKPPGEILFFEETFGGNGRTCGTCHVPPTFKIHPKQIEQRAADDPLFVGKFDITPGLIEKGLFTAPLPNPVAGEPPIIVHRNVPTLFNLASTGPFMWDLRAADLPAQINGAVMLHFHDNDLTDSPTKRMPTATEIEDLITFMLTIHSDPSEQDPVRVANGEALFFGKAQCAVCHVPPLFTDNQSHDTNVAGSQVSVQMGLPFDPGVCRVNPAANDCAVSGTSFKTRHLVGIRHGRPYFHNNSGSNLFSVMDFYTSNVFRNSPAAQRLGIVPFELTLEEKQDLHAYLFTL